MALRLPFRRLSDDFVRASRDNHWRSLGTLVDRNFEEIAKQAEPGTLVTGSASTTSATATPVLSIEIPASTTVGLDVTVLARRTGGTAGTAEDGAHYRRHATYKNVAGTATIIGAVSSPHTAESQAGWDVTFVPSGSRVEVRVTGAANNNVAWEAHARVHKVTA